VASALQGTAVPQDVIRMVPGSAMPAVVGLFRRRITVSEAMIAQLTVPELKAVLLHENEHRRRYDPLRSVIQRCALALFFYYPLLWMVQRRLASSCEIACDEAAVGGGITPRAYARALARTINIGLLPSYSPAGIGTGTSSLLHQRLGRLDRNRRYVIMMRHRLAFAAAVAVVLAVSLIPLPPLAGTEESNQALKAPPPPPKSVAAEDGPAPPAGPAELVDEQTVEPPKLVPESYVLPEYPEAARKDGASGKVILEVMVKKDGTPGRISVTQGVEGYPALAENAIEAVSQWTFKPATKGGKPIDMAVAIPVAFRLDDTE
jgi:TonB family protein